MGSEFIATCGTYHVMARLALNEIHAAATFGNAPHVDILVSSSDGYSSLAIQVKTAASAGRSRGRGQLKMLDHYEWTLGRKAGKANSTKLFFAFVDLNIYHAKPMEAPTTFIIPSYDIYNFCAGWIDNTSWPRFHPSVAYLEPYKENWGLIEKALRLTKA